ncbi:hypothetical protein UA32_03150 [Photobacterium angustum]|uniref:Uncharacterized protein n=2 Tax=Photobacterium angustum TaxID=661 RepID=A0ABX5H9X3_PHOAN|nr:hypothetical protein UA32_03150 [Photobacterium angustum]PSX12417.1 hypothetical protein C0W27_02615 [Photobacterium angustum]
MTNKLTLKDRIYTLISGVPPTPKLTEKELDELPRGITIRFKPQVRKFLEHQASHLGCSMQDLVSMTMTSVMKATDNPAASELELTCSRFRRCFEVYGINTFDIPEFLNTGELSRSQLMEDQNLIDALTDDMFKEIATILNIESNWIKGITERPIPYNGHYRWYKRIGGMAYQLARYRMSGEKIRVLFIVDYDNSQLETDMAKATEDDSTSEKLNIGVAISRVIDVSGKECEIYDVLESGRWNYWKCRYHLKLLMMFCQKTGIDFTGIRLNHQEYTQLFEGEKLPPEILSRTNNNWYPDLLLLDDEEINPEFSELKDIKASYYRDESEASIGDIHIHEKALRKPWDLVDRKAYIEGNMFKEVN